MGGPSVILPNLESLVCSRERDKYHRAVLLSWVRADAGGNYYYSQALDMEGWLCPALLEYFDNAPAELYFQVKPKPADQGAALKPGEVTVSFEYRRHVGPRYVHGSVTLRFAPGTAFEFRSIAVWPRSDDYTQAVEVAVREVLSSRSVLHSTVCTLVSVGWDEIASCESGFMAAARVATLGAFEV